MVMQAVDRRATLHILSLLVRRDLRLRYAGAWLGYGWTLLEPLLMTLVYAFVFGVLLSAGRDFAETPYVLYLVVGVLSWNWFSSAVNESTKALNSEAKIVRTASVPREIWVARTVIAKMAEFVFAIPVIAIFVIYYKHPISWEIVLFPVGMLLQLVFSYGLGLLLAPLSVIAGDVKRLVRIFLRVGFYLTPVLYSLNAVDQRFGDAAALAKINPVAASMSLLRAGLWPEDIYEPVYYAWAVVITLATLALGTWVFRRLVGTVLKEI